VTMVEYVKGVWQLMHVMWAMWKRLQSMKRNRWCCCYYCS